MARVTHVKKAAKAQRNCAVCHTEINAGDAYSWCKPGFRAAKVTHCGECSWRPSQTTGSPYISQLYAARESVEDVLADWDTETGSTDDLRDALEAAVEEAREVAQAYEDAAEAMGDAGENMRDEYAAPAEEWAEALESAAGDLEDFDPEAEEDEDEDAVEDRRNTWADEQRDAVETALGELAL